MRSLVGNGLAGCCTVLSLLGVIILGVLGIAFDKNAEVLVGSTKLPVDGPTVAKTCWMAAAVYLAFIVFCTCQIGVNNRYARGSVRI